jgi:hypothetical protein
MIPGQFLQTKRALNIFVLISKFYIYYVSHGFLEIEISETEDN